MITRRTLGASVTAAGLIFCAGSSAAQALKPVKIGIINITDVAPLYAAVKFGYFEAEGIKLEISPITGGAAAIPGLIGGAFDIVFGNSVSTLLAVQQGLPLQVIAPGNKMFEGAAVPLMIGRKADAYKTAADMRGKSFAVNNRNNVNWLYGRAWVKVKGGNPDDAIFKEVPFPQMLDALKRRQVDGAFMVEPFQSAAQKDPELGVIGSPYLEVQPGADVGQYLATRDFIAKNPETVAKFLRGLRRGIGWYNANLNNPELYELVSSYTKIPVDIVKSFKLTALPPVVSLEQHQKTAQLMQIHGMVATPIDVSKVIHPIALSEK